MRMVVASNKDEIKMSMVVASTKNTAILKEDTSPPEQFGLQ